MCPREVGRPVSRLLTLSWASPLKLLQRDLPVACRWALELASGMVGAGPPGALAAGLVGSAARLAWEPESGGPAGEVRLHV